jgi:hypothetical protein
MSDGPSGGPNGEALSKKSNAPVPLVGSIVLDSHSCFSCGGKHSQIECKPYSKDNPPYTHFYLCPTTGDPVGIAIVVSNNIRMELHDKAVRDIFEAQGKPLMFIVARMTKANEVTVTVHNESFPFARYEDVVRLTAITLKKMMPPEKPSEPLPLADAGLMAMFGRRAKNAGMVVAPFTPGVVAEQPAQPAVAEAACAETPPPFGDEGDTEVEPDSEDENR